MKLVGCDVRVAADRRQIGVAKVFGDKSCVTGRLPEPRRGCVSERVRGDVLLNFRSCCSATDNVCERSLLKTAACESAKDRIAWRRLSLIA